MGISLKNEQKQRLGIIWNTKLKVTLKTIHRNK